MNHYRFYVRFLAGLMTISLLLGLVVFTTAQSVSAVTIGDPFDNTGSDRPDNTYTIPGHGTRGPDEGSFFKTGTAASGTPITTGNSGDWEAGNAESPVTITFPDTSDSSYPSEYGKPFYSINYVDKNDFLDFSSADQANNFNKTGTAAYNPNNVASKMDANNELKSGQTYDNGYLQITGNVPIHAQLSSSETSVDAAMAGNWGVMARVTLPAGVDAKSLGGSVDWSKSYFYLNLQTIEGKLLFLGSYQLKNINFPLQFDHHIYLDSQKSNVFYLKVKGIPFKFLEGSNSTTAQMQLQNGAADYLDYLHNVYLSSGTPSTLDKLNSPDTIGSGSSIQPNFQEQTGGNNTVWDPFRGLAYDSLIDSWGSGWPASSIIKVITGALTPSLVYNAGSVGRAISLLNAADASGNRQLTHVTGANWTDLFALFQSFVLKPITSSLANFFVSNGFYGSAHINFSFDMSKYRGSSDTALQSLTTNRLFSAPYKDGTFNTGDTSGSSDANRRSFGITMYDSNQLVDKYNVLSGMDRKDPTKDTALLNQMKAGTSPMDYALIKTGTTGTEFPVYTNFTSWTAAAVPYDKDTTNDTLHSSGNPIGDDMRYRTATPDPRTDGALLNDGSNISVTKDWDHAGHAPQFSADKKTLEKAGSITPERYANVYEVYDYSQSTPTVAPHPIYSADEPSLKLAVTNSGSENIGTGYSGEVSKDFSPGQWIYSGSLNGIPIASANLGLNQSLTPNMDLSSSPFLIVPKTSVTNGQHQTYSLGSWRDGLIINNDTMTAALNGFDGTKYGTATANNLVTSTTANKVGLGLADTYNYGFAQKGPYGDITPEFKMPPAATTDPVTFYSGDFTLSRQDDIPVHMPTTQPTIGSTLGTKKASTLIALINNAHASYTITRSQDTQYAYANGQTITATGVVKNVGTDSSRTKFVVVVPTPAGLTLADYNFGAANGTVSKDTNITAKLGGNAAAYDVTLTNPLPVGQTFTYTAKYQVADMSQLPINGTPFQDLLLDPDTLDYLGESNTNWLYPAASPYLQTVPSFDFGKHPQPGSTVTYATVAGNKQTFAVTDPDTASTVNNWSLFAQLSPFVNGDSNLSDLAMTFGTPNGETKPADYDANKANNEMTDDDWLYFNHTANTVPSNQSMQRLYRLDTSLEPTVDPKNAALDYSGGNGGKGVTLTVPANDDAAIKLGKYNATITYTLDSNKSTIN
ncbi:hypothetical protein FMM01_10910 [Schleiferilactobacillus harbinensis]|uniref:hypothetical protein n=1 Tax=Schleiferilactobacillus harbinensis TaxID=304207 RepID=UPI00123BCBDA|nr:hypothetical protein [Schleiferilactobacillus harbinensis]QEU47770.1 hypothetical protein FMM01_10910 [Schleiferilactobacillus harbinensis]